MARFCGVKTSGHYHGGGPKIAPMTTPILILAAGQSSRMRGADKLLQLVDGVPLVRKVAVAAIALGHPVYVALPDLTHPRAAALSDLDLTLLPIPQAVQGMSVTLREAVAHLPEFEKLMLVLADLPEISSSEMAAVLSASDRQSGLIWRGATEDGKPGHPIVFDGSLRTQFATLSGDTGGDAIVRLLRDQTVLVPLAGSRARRDLDTPEDWAAFRAETGR